MKWEPKINIESNESAFNYLVGYRKRLTKENPTEYKQRLNAKIDDIIFESYINYAAAIRIKSSKRLYILTKHGRISIFLKSKEQAAYAIENSTLLKSKKFFNMKYEKEDSDWFVFSNDKVRIFMKKDIGTIFMNKTQYKVGDIWLSKNDYKNLTKC